MWAPPAHESVQYICDGFMKRRIVEETGQPLRTSFVASSMSEIKAGIPC